MPEITCTLDRRTVHRGMDLEDLSARVRKLRLKHGLSQQELADHAGVNRMTVGKLEAGAEDMRVAKLVAILDHLGLKLKVVSKRS